jgi:hypothetical protein
MRFTKLIPCLISVFISRITIAQNVPFNSAETIWELKQHVSVLSHDSLEGRLVGSTAEVKASNYISSQLQSFDVKPKGTNGHLQSFSFKRSIVDKSGTVLEIKTKNRTITFHSSGNDFSKLGVYPAAMSGYQKAKGKSVWVNYGIETSDGTMNDYSLGKQLKGKIFVMQHGYPTSQFHPHSAVAEAASIEKKIEKAIAYGAIGVVIIRTDSTQNMPAFKKHLSKNSAVTIPVLFLNRVTENLEIYMKNPMMSINPMIHEKEIVGNNVIGYIHNNASKTIIIGAHYDHLGRDEFGHSTYRGDSTQQIHNGADDNASGTSALIVLADILKKHGSQNMNYLFIAFSGEEEGLLGSNYFVKNPTIEMSTVVAMFNMDMVGRLDKDKYTLGINGTGTAKEWNDLLKSIQIDSLKYKYTESGTGASDHTSFYNVNIPALHYFTGTHHDYHKPSDDEDKINYDGIYKVISHIYLMNEALAKSKVLTFQKTKEDTATKVSFKVTLGIMPDYLYDGAGVMVDGVTPERPAAKSGIIKGDCVIQLGDIKITDMQSYMKALSQFSKGQQTTVSVLRAGKEIVMNLTF